MHFTRLLLLLTLCLIMASPGRAQVEESIVINDGELEIPITRYAAFEDNAPLLLWIPSARGTSPKQAITAVALGDIDIETWVVDLHMAYFVDAGRDSEKNFKAGDIAELIRIAASRTRSRVYVMASGASAAPALQGIARYQQQTAKSGEPMQVGGSILFYPSLNYPSKEPGAAIRYLPVAKNSTIPIYYFQPGISTRQWRSQEILETLQSGGSQVFFRPMPGIVAGFHMRPDDDLSDADLIQRARLPADLKQAIKILSVQPGPAPPASLVAKPAPTGNGSRFGLKPLRERAALPLNLIHLDGQAATVDYTEHKLSLVSFWASWCEPCIRELPALNRLQHDYTEKGLQIITVNVGESAQEIQETITQFGMQNYLNLRDPEGEAMKTWNVNGFPTNFLVKSDGQLSHGSFGAVEWDEAEVRAQIDGQL